jgi:hypothetical protein
MQAKKNKNQKTPAKQAGGWIRRQNKPLRSVPQRLKTQ